MVLFSEPGIWRSGTGMGVDAYPQPGSDLPKDLP